ncbi:MAG: hypothetical protein MSG64_05690 [Pyrinomonadaceae bacterium MAG19_C2-C3]|nr:hypothetical protein [Pyrinomonadaceae bacterium MAG19_C2-C3]
MNPNKAFMRQSKLGRQSKADVCKCGDVPAFNAMYAGDLTACGLPI